MPLKIGDKIALKLNRRAWGYSDHIVPAGEVGVVTAVNVPVVRKVGKRNSYHVASFGPYQADFNAGEFVRAK